jgi:hypothetical protein
VSGLPRSLATVENLLSVSVWVPGWNAVNLIAGLGRGG